MTKLSFIIFSLLLSFNASATVDAMTSTWIVLEGIQEPEDFTLQQVPVIGCYGLPQGPELEQFVSEYKIKSTIGCGFVSTEMVNVNALSCAKLVSSEENTDYMSFKKITLDISSCVYKNNARFITLVRTAAARNFPQTKDGKVVKGKEVELTLLK